MFGQAVCTCLYSLVRSLCSMRPLSPSASQWYYTADVLANTPSAADGMTLETELKKRKLAVGYIISLGLRAGLDRHGLAMRAVIMTAATFLHRFYMRRSMNDIKPEKAAAAILFLASKTEEAPLKLRHVATAASGKFDIQRAQEAGQNITDEFKASSHAKWEKIILLVEEQVLEAICFDLVVEQPWSGIVKGLRALLAAGAGAGAGAGAVRGGRPEERKIAAESSAPLVVPEKATATATGPAVDGGLSKADVKMEVDGQAPVEAPVPAETQEPAEAFDAPSWAFKEDEVLETSMILLNELYVTPLPILYPPPILSAAILVLSISILTQQPIPATQRYLYLTQPRHRIALAQTLGLDLERGANASKYIKEDVDVLDECLAQFAAYQTMGLVDQRLSSVIPPSIRPADG